MGKFFSNFYAGFRRRLASFGLESYYVELVLFSFFAVWAPFHWDEWILIWGFLIAAAPFILPILTYILMSAMLLEYRRQQDYWSTEHTVLEVRLPEEITQSPHAAELFFRVLYQSGEVDTILHHWRGKTKPWFSLEIVSIEGAVRFYVWTRSRYAEMVKAQLYAHYPTVQVVEVPDYTMQLPFNLDEMDLWGVEQALQKPDPYPIQTYMEWNVEKADTKEEFKNDPLVSVIEALGSIGPGEQLWFQIVLKGHTSNLPPSYAPWAADSTDEHGHHIHDDINIAEWAEIEKKKILEKTVVDEKDKPNYSRLSQGDKDALDAIERKLQKQAFDVGIRFIYLAKKEKFLGERRASLPTVLRSFEHGSEGRGLNGLKPIFYIGPFNWPWEDFKGIRRAALKKKFYRGYVSRQYFHSPFQDMHIVLNIEEIASLWHFPGKVAHTPTLQRMPSRRAEAPANLPVGSGPF